MEEKSKRIKAAREIKNIQMKIIKVKENDSYFNCYIKKAVVILDDGTIAFVKSNSCHNINGPSFIYDNYRLWHYKDKYYGENDDFTNKSWKKKVSN